MRAATAASAAAISGWVVGDLLEFLAGEVVADRVGDDEVPVGEALHQRRRAEAVGPVVREVGLAEDEEPGDRAHEVVVHPQAAHRVVAGGVDPHRHLVRVLVGDALVHLEEVAVLLLDLGLPEAGDRVLEIEVDAESRGPDAAALVADLLGGPRGDVPRREVPEARVHALEVVVALLFRDLARRTLVALGPGHPDPPVVAERLGHERQLRLVLAGDRDAGRVDLGEAGVGEGRALLVRAPDRRRVAALGVGREVEDVAVAAGRQAHGVGHVGLDLAGDHVAHDDAARAAVDDHELQHLVARVHLDRAQADLALERLVGAQQQLLSRLAAGIEGPRDLRAAEGAVVEEAAVLAREGHAERDALVDDRNRDLRQPVDVRLARPEISALDGVVEQALNAVAVVVVVLRGVDAALRGDRVRPPGRVLVAEALDVVAELGHGGRAARARQARPDHDDRVLALVGRVDELHLEAVLVPLLVEGTGGDVGVELHGLGAPPVTG